MSGDRPVRRRPGSGRTPPWQGETCPTTTKSVPSGSTRRAQASGQAPPPVSVPVGFTTFPGEVFAAPRSWVAAVHPNLAYFNEVEKGGHFAAWEEPELFAPEIRAAFSSLR